MFISYHSVSQAQTMTTITVLQCPAKDVMDMFDGIAAVTWSTSAIYVVEIFTILYWVH